MSIWIAQSSVPHKTGFLYHNYFPHYILHIYNTQWYFTIFCCRYDFFSLVYSLWVLLSHVSVAFINGLCMRWFLFIDILLLAFKITNRIHEFDVAVCSRLSAVFYLPNYIRRVLSSTYPKASWACTTLCLVFCAFSHTVICRGLDAPIFLISQICNIINMHFMEWWIVTYHLIIMQLMEISLR